MNKRKIFLLVAYNHSILYFTFSAIISKSVLFANGNKHAFLPFKAHDSEKLKKNTHTHNFFLQLFIIVIKLIKHIDESSPAVQVFLQRTEKKSKIGLRLFKCFKCEASLYSRYLPHLFCSWLLTPSRMGRLVKGRKEIKHFPFEQFSAFLIWIFICTLLRTRIDFQKSLLIF